MKIETRVPTFTETSDAIVIRIPKVWVRMSSGRQLTDAQVLRMVARGEREFRRGKTRSLHSFLAKRHLNHATPLKRSR